MEPKFKTSFIPKKPIMVDTSARVASTGGGFSFFTLLAVILFLATLIFSGGVWVYKKQVQATIDDQLESLRTAHGQFDPEFIDQATRLSQRLSTAGSILDTHIAPSEIFRLFEEKTLKTIAFSNFTFSDSEDGGVSVVASGVGDSFKSIVLQSDEFGNTNVLRDVLFDGVQPTEDGNVSFSFSATLVPEFILYRKNLVPVETNDEPPAVEPVEDNLGVFSN